MKQANSCTCYGNILWALPVLDPKSQSGCSFPAFTQMHYDFRNQCSDAKKRVFWVIAPETGKSASINFPIATGLTQDNYATSSYV